MESCSSRVLLGNGEHEQEISEDPAEESHNLQTVDRVCGSTGCGFSDSKSKEGDSHARSAAARKLGIAMVLCLVFVAVEVAGGLISNSLAILTDAAHLLSDVAGFAISLFAIWASSWEATPQQSYGYFRLEILGALLSIQLIWLLTGIIVYEAIYRIVNSSQPIDGRLMFIVACFGLFVNIAMVLLLGHHGHSHGHHHAHGHEHEHGQEKGHKHLVEHSKNRDHDYNLDQDDDHSHDHYHDHDDVHSESDDCLIGAVEECRRSYGEVGRKDSLKVDMDIDSDEKSETMNTDSGNINVRGAWLHVFGDLIQSVGVMIGGAIIWAEPQWRVVDLICTLLFSVLVLGTTIVILRDIVEILMESTPREIDVKKLEKGLCDIPGVKAVHDLHVWAITMGKTLFSCHVTIFSDADADSILQKVLHYCERVFNISHVTVQIERQPETL